MRKGLLLLFFLVSIISEQKAAHISGGEITWKCLSNGKFQFYMRIYRDCRNIPLTYQNEPLYITGNPLPLDVNGINSITSLILKPDSNRWQNAGFGDLDPACDTSGGSLGIDCSSRDARAVQQFFYISDPIVLNGLPPQQGWNFYWESPCCRTGSIKNISSFGTFSGDRLLKATMYAGNTNQSMFPCFDSSPEFIENPTTLICRGKYNTYSNMAIDLDGDSLAYKWGVAINDPIPAPTTLPFHVGYSRLKPTPDTSFHQNNKASRLDSTNGLNTLAIYNGIGLEKYLMVHVVEAWRDGLLMSVVKREFPLNVVDCPNLINQHANGSPLIYLNGLQLNEIEMNVTAGQMAQVAINVVDSDSVSTVVGWQELSLRARGVLFASDLINDTLCLDSAFQPCAYLSTQSPQLDTSFLPSEYTIRGFANVSTTFTWETDCKHLGANGADKSYYFYLNASDDFCPVPGGNSAVIKVNVLGSGSPCQVTGLAEKEGFEQLQYYPNPTTGKLRVELGRVHQQLELTVRNIHGQLVQQKTYSASSRLELDLQGMPGIYFLELRNEQGETANWKVVKQ